MTSRPFLLALALVAMACSSGDDAASTTGPTTSAPATTGTTITPGPSPSSAESSSSTTTSDGEGVSTSSPTDTSPPSSSSTVVADPTTTIAGDTTPQSSTSQPADESDLSDAEMADRELARSALIDVDDFPDGWVEDPLDEDDTSDTDGFEAEFDACLGRDDDDQLGERLERLAVGTGDFHPTDSDATQVAHEVALAPDDDTAVERMAQVDVAGAEECVADVIGRFYEQAAAEEDDLAGIDIGQVRVTRTENERPADLAVGVLIEIPLTVDGQTVSQFLEFLYHRQGRALSELSFSSFGQPFSRDGYTILSDTVVIDIASIG